MPRRKRLDTTPEWKALKAHAATLKAASLRELFAADPARAQAFSLEVGGWYLDYSKNLATAETMKLLQIDVLCHDLPRQLTVGRTSSRAGDVEPTGLNQEVVDANLPVGGREPDASGLER